MIRQTELKLDLGASKTEAMRYVRHNPDVTLRDFLGCYKAHGIRPLPDDYFHQPLKNFLISPITLRTGTGILLSPDDAAECGASGELRNILDKFHEQDLTRTAEPEAYPARTAEPETYPARIRDSEAVRIAYRKELQRIARFLENDLSVLILCDKMLTEHIYEYVCKLAHRKPVLDDAVPNNRPDTTREAFDQAMQGGGGIESSLPLLIRNLKPDQVLVLRSLDILDNPSLIELLYQGSSGDKKTQLLGFLDPSLEVKKVLSNRFAVHTTIMGLWRHFQPDPDKPPVHTVTRLITANERECFREFDPENLYKNVSGLNAIQFRNAMRYVGATVTKGSDPRDIDKVIRQFKTNSSDEIEIPDTAFEHIGGYERVKQELKRIIALVDGQVKGIDEKERKNMIPGGFVFHGEPGTGKTLFAKAIANEMNATIQMISGPEIMDKYVGQSESNIRRIFSTARRNAPSVIFFDEFDSIASQRSTYSGGGERVNNAVVAQLLTELDGFRQDQTVLVIGTTNRIDIIDEALLRPSRLCPIEIGLPDYTARQEVARIHARTFGIDKLLTDICRLTLRHLPAWIGNREIPPGFLEDIFARHPPHKTRCETEIRQEGFARELQAMFELIHKSGSGNEQISEKEHPLFLQLEDRLIRTARTYGLDLTPPDSPDAQAVMSNESLQTMQSDIRDLFDLLKQQNPQEGGFSPETFLEGILSLIAEYSDGFNNDEIRAIFQEASREYYLEGQLITPRYIGMKIGLIKKRRDEREVSHLSGSRPRG